MTFINSYNTDVILSNNMIISHCENFSGMKHPTYGEISPQQNNSTPVSSDCYSERHNQSTLSSKKSEISAVSTEEECELTVDSLERTLTNDRISKIEEILAMLECLNDSERLLVQLKFPVSEKDDFEEINVDISGQCDFGLAANQNEHNEALTWAVSHLEEDRSTCLKKQEVYEDYKSFCLSHNFKYLSTADFGKVMKKAFPNIKARRLGARGQSKYCYSGLKNRNEINSPKLIDVGLNCDKKDNFNDYVHQDKNSDRDSVLSNSQPPDLSKIPEYDLSHNILVDSALVIMDFIKSIGITKELTSLKQAVAYILLNNQVETRTPHALRLLPMFQDMELQKSKTKYNNSLERTIKKEESVANPDSVPQFQTAQCPHTLKRAKIPYVSPIPNKVPSYYDNGKVSPMPPLTSFPSFAHSHINHFNYGINNNPLYYHNRMLNLPANGTPIMQNHRLEFPQLVSSKGQKQFIPDTYPTPMKDQQTKNKGPTINSSLLERNTTTNKKFDILNSPKSLQEISLPSYSSMLPSIRTASYTYESTLNIEDNNSGNKKLTKNSYLDNDVESPISMTQRDYKSTSLGENYVFESKKYETPNLPSKRHIRSNFPINLNPSPILNHFAVDSDYGNHDSLSTGYRQHSSEENEYLDTPGNSPTSRSTYQDPMGQCAHGDDPLAHLPMKNPPTTTDPADENFSYANLLAFEPKYIFCMDESDRNVERGRGGTDESCVTSTTNICAAESDRHPSTTVMHSSVQMTP